LNELTGGRTAYPTSEKKPSLPAPVFVMSFTRRHLPHWIPDNSIIFVTWKVAEGSPLADPRCAQLVADALIYGTKMYELHAWVVMPTHVHAVITPKRPLPEIMRWLKWTTARRCNRLLGRTGAFWQDESLTTGSERP
jgi:hypothetical protein